MVSTFVYKIPDLQKLTTEYSLPETRDSDSETNWARKEREEFMQLIYTLS